MGTNGARTEVSLSNFFIFNPNFGIKEGEELKKILFYYPITDNADVQIKNVGLVEGILQFTGTFKPNGDVSSFSTQKTRQIYFQPEKDYWLVMTLKLPKVQKSGDGVKNFEYLDHEVQDNVYEAILKQSYYMYRLFWNSFQSLFETENVNVLKTKLESFYSAYIKTMKLEHCDILNIFSGIQYLPLDKETFLKVECFVNFLESSYPQIAYSTILYNDHLVWSGIDPIDMQTIYHYLVGTLLPANMECELQGGSMPRNASPFAALHHGKFITGPTNLKNAKTIGKVPKIFTYHGESKGCYHLIVYRALSASVCLFIKAETELSLQFFHDIDKFISPKLSSLVSQISDYCSKQVVTPLPVTETTARFIYFNKNNAAYKSTVHLDNKQTGNIAISSNQLKTMADLKRTQDLSREPNEILVKTCQELWVVSRKSNGREFFISEQQKNAHLIEIHKSVNALCESELKGIFFNSI